MKTFKTFLKEEETKPVRLRLLPAIKHESGKLHIGKRGEDHSEIREKHADENGPLKGEAGFYDPLKKSFMSRKEAAQHAPRPGSSGESTEFLTYDEREARKKRQEGGDSTDRMSDMQRMRRYGTFEETDPMLAFRKKVDAKRLTPTRASSKGGSGGDGGGGDGGSMEESALQEGNPLARMHQKQEEGTHFVAISTERPGLTKKQVKARNDELVASARAAGYGVRKAQGHYEGSKESSHIIHAKAPGKEAGADLVRFARSQGKKYDQDSILHHNGKTARLVGTNETGFPGMDKSEKVGGKLKYNNPESPFQTELKPSKKKAPARFTTE